MRIGHRVDPASRPKRRGPLSPVGYAVGTALLIVVALAAIPRPTVTVGALPPNKNLPTFGDAVRKGNLN